MYFQCVYKDFEAFVLKPPKKDGYGFYLHKQCKLNRQRTHTTIQQRSLTIRTIPQCCHDFTTIKTNLCGWQPMTNTTFQLTGGSIRLIKNKHS